jgi:hypothetical protein
MFKGTFSLTSEHKYTILHRDTATKAILIELESYQKGPKPDQMHSALEVNSDGSPRAYHLLDPEGKHFALNDLYSGGVRVFRDNNEIDIGEHRDVYYDTIHTLVDDHGNFGLEPSKYLARDDNKYNRGGDFGLGLDEPHNRFFEEVIELLWAAPEHIPAKKPSPSDHNLILKCKSINCEVWFPDNIFLYNGDGLCVRNTGRYAGFLVNRLSVDSLQNDHPQAGNPADPENSEDAKCGSVINVDAEKLPGLVLPGNGLRADGTDTFMQMGDIVVGYYPNRQSWAFGIIADGGPKGNVFGEASIAFTRILRGGGYLGNSIPRPEKYRRLDKNDKAPIVLSGSIDASVELLLLPSTAKKFKSGPRANGKYDFSPETIAAFGKAAFLEWANASDLPQARALFRKCTSLLSDLKKQK